MFHPGGEETHFVRATGRGKDVEVRRETQVAAPDVELPLPGGVKVRFRLADGDSVLAGVQVGNGDREVRPVNLLPERFVAAAGGVQDRGAFCGGMVELAADEDLPVARGARLVGAEGGGNGRQEPCRDKGGDQSEAHACL